MFFLAEAIRDLEIERDEYKLALELACGKLAELRLFNNDICPHPCKINNGVVYDDCFKCIMDDYLHQARKEGEKDGK